MVNNSNIGDFTWVKTHEELVKYLKNQEKEQEKLIKILSDVGIKISSDKFNNAEITLTEIDPFTFFTQIYKHSSSKNRLDLLQRIAKKLNITSPTGESGIPSSQPQKSWWFGFRDLRDKDDINMIWNFFDLALNNKISNNEFKDILDLKGIGKAKLTEGLFYIMPKNYLPMDKPINVYLEEKLNIDPNFETFDEYIGIINNVKEAENKELYEISYDAWLYSSKKSTINEKSSEYNISKIQSNKNLNQILYGPPGTGKTYNTINKTIEIIDPDYFKKHSSDSDDDREKLLTKFNELKANNQVSFVTFHQSYGYEEFVEGIRAITPEKSQSDTNEMTYKVVDGVFRKICKIAQIKKSSNFDETYNAFITKIIDNGNKHYQLKTKTKQSFWVDVNKNNNLKLYTTNNKNYQGSLTKEKLEAYLFNKNVFPGWEGYAEGVKDKLIKQFNLKIFDKDNSKKKFVLIIDEINRGNISKIFGELITLIEESKRIDTKEELKVTLPYSGEEFGVPKNLYIIGTMNTADRSIALMDTALRRRFEFIEMMPKPKILKKVQINDFKEIQLDKLLETINQRIEYLYDRDHMIGHSYLMHLKNRSDLDNAFRNKIIPLLQEYFYDDWEKIQLVLGDHNNQKTIDEHKFITCEKLKEHDVLACKYEEIDEDKKKYTINETFEKEAYLKIYREPENKTNG